MKPLTFRCKCLRAIAVSRCEAIGIPAAWLCKDCVIHFWNSVYALVGARG